VKDHEEMAKDLDVSGTYIKYFGSKRDVVFVQGQLFDAKLRWKRLTVRSREKGRHLQQAYRKSKQVIIDCFLLHCDKDYLDTSCPDSHMSCSDFL